MLTLKETGGGRRYLIPYAGIVTAVSSAQTLPTQATASLWYLDPGNAYNHVHISKDSTTVTVTINNDVVYNYTGTIGSTYADLIKNVLTTYFGEWTSAWAELHCTDQLLSVAVFVRGSGTSCKPIDPGLVVADYGDNGTYLDFAVSIDLGTDIAHAKTLPVLGSDCCEGGTPIESSHWGYRDAAQAFDGVLGEDYDMWCPPTTGNAVIGEWLGYLFGLTKEITQVKIRTVYVPYNVASIRVEYTTNNGSTWTTAQDFTGCNIAYSWITLELDNSVNCDGIRIMAQSGVSAGKFWCISEMEVISIEKYVSPNDWTITGSQSTITPTS